MAGDDIEDARDKKLYTMFITSFKGGLKMHILHGILESSFTAWSVTTCLEHNQSDKY